MLRGLELPGDGLAQSGSGMVEFGRWLHAAASDTLAADRRKG